MGAAQIFVPANTTPATPTPPGVPGADTDAVLRDKGLDPVENPEEYEAAWDDALTAAEAAVASGEADVAQQVMERHIRSAWRSLTIPG